MPANDSWDHGHRQPSARPTPDRSSGTSESRTPQDHVMTLSARLSATTGKRHRTRITVRPGPHGCPRQRVLPPPVAPRSSPCARYTRYLVPNFKSKVMSNDKARQALALATDRRRVRLRLPGGDHGRGGDKLAHSTRTFPRSRTPRFPRGVEGRPRSRPRSSSRPPV